MKSLAPPRRKSWGEFIGQKFSLTSVAAWSSIFGLDNWAGIPVTAQRAQQISAVWRALRLTSETIASLPLNFYTDNGAGPVVTRGSDVDALLRVSPNGEQTTMEFLEQLLGCMELVGDGLARKHYQGRRVVALTLMDPLRAVLDENVQGTPFWKYTDARGRYIELPTREVFQLKGWSMGGRRGASTVSYGAQTMSLALAAQKTAGKLFKSGLRSSGFVSTNGVIEEPDRARLTQILDQYTGQDKAGGIMLLEAGMDFKPITMNAADAELLLTRRFEIEEIGRWFGMPPILLGHAVDGQTMWGSGVDSIISAWRTLGLAQRLKRVELAIAKRLMSPEERAQGLYAKFNEDALMRVDSESRIRFLATAAQNGFMSRNEARSKMELGRVEGADDLTVQVNLVPIGLLGQESGSDAAAKAQFRAWLGLDNDEDRPPLQLPPPGA